jgi:diaminopimelate epimerase
MSMLQFFKLHGIGNDFVFLDCVEHDLDLHDSSELAKEMCDRHKGVGADGLIIVGRGDAGRFRMTMYNPDGTRGGMCGNGVRCTAHLLIERGHHGLEPFELEVEERTIRVSPVRPDWVKVEMGGADLTRGDIGILGPPQERVLALPICTS